MRTCIVSILVCIGSWKGLPAQSLPNFRQVRWDNNIPSSWRVIIGKGLERYPELAHTRIRFRVRHARSPLTTNRDWVAFLLHFGRQAYIVTISDRTIPKLSPILFDSLDEGAKLGVIGHELGHVSDFSRRNLSGWLSLGLGHLSSRYLDRMEFATDSLCIAHGLGKKPRERYMNPETIIARLAGPCE